MFTLRRPERQLKPRTLQSQNLIKRKNLIFTFSNQQMDTLHTAFYKFAIDSVLFFYNPPLPNIPYIEQSIFHYFQSARQPSLHHAEISFEFYIDIPHIVQFSYADSLLYQHTINGLYSFQTFHNALPLPQVPLFYKKKVTVLR